MNNFFSSALSYLLMEYLFTPGAEKGRPNGCGADRCCGYNRGQQHHLQQANTDDKRDAQRFEPATPHHIHADVCQLYNASASLDCGKNAFDCGKNALSDEKITNSPWESVRKYWKLNWNAEFLECKSLDLPPTDAFALEKIQQASNMRTSSMIHGFATIDLHIDEDNISNI